MANTAPVAKKVARSLTLKELGFTASEAKALIEKTVAEADEAALKALPKDATDEAKDEAIDAARAAIRVPVAVMFGIITKIKDELRQDGTVGSSLVGSFEGHNIQTKAIVGAPRCYVPDVQETVETDFRNMPNKVGGNRMKFRANVFLVYADNRYGYNYSVDLPLRDTSNDPLAEMRRELKL